MGDFYILVTGATPTLLSAAVVTASQQGYVINGGPFASGSTLIQNMLLQKQTYSSSNPERLSRWYRSNVNPTGSLASYQ